MTYVHEPLGGSRHLLTVWDDRSGVTWLADSYQSMTVFAHRWAATQFPGGYEFEGEERVNSAARVPFTAPRRSFVIKATE